MASTSHSPFNAIGDINHELATKVVLISVSETENVAELGNRDTVGSDIQRSAT